MSKNFLLKLPRYTPTLYILRVLELLLAIRQCGIFELSHWDPIYGYHLLGCVNFKSTSAIMGQTQFTGAPPHCMTSGLGTGVQPSAMPSPTTITTTQTPTEIGLGTGVTVLHSLVTGTVGPPTPTPTSALPTHPSTSPGSVGTELPTTKRQSESNDSPTAVEISTWVAIGVGSILVIVLITVISVLLYFIYRRTTSKERGFYKTEESEAAIPRYSASLQKVSSQSVSSSASNGNAYVATDRSRDREYFI